MHQYNKNMAKNNILLCYVFFIMTYVDGLLDEKQVNVNNASESNIDLLPVNGWPKDSWANQLQIGQISAVSFDNNDNILVFHRGSRNWNADSFLLNNVYNHINEGPINTDTVIILRASDGAIKGSWGSNIFYMPHGLTVDFEGNVWLTDVALHQVYKFSSDGKKSLLTLGTKFQPGNDVKHFCKPTSVAVMTNGDFFVADGYCNSRIVKFSSDGKKILQWGTNGLQGIGLMNTHRTHYTLDVPHALTLAEDQEELCVADRENGRIICYDCHNGTYLWSFQHKIVGPRIFSVAYSPLAGGQLYIVNGPAPFTTVKGFVVSMHSDKILSQFGVNLSNPHDISVSKDGSKVFIVELDPHAIHKYVKEVAEVMIVEKEVQKEHSNIFSNNMWIVGTVIGFGLTTLIICAVIILMKIMQKRKESSQDWIKPAVMDKVFRLNKLTDRQNSVQGFQRLKTDESDDETVATVNI